MVEFDHRLIDDVIHSRIRLAVMAVLASVDTAEFSYLREQTKTTDGNLGTHLRTLEEAGYVRSATRLGDHKPLRDYSLTRKGRDAFGAYVSHLESLAAAGQGKGRK